MLSFLRIWRGIHLGIKVLISAFIIFFSISAEAKVYTFAVVGDGGMITPEQIKVKDSILKTPIRNLIMPGDNLYELSYEAIWGDWKKKGFNFEITALGNHHGGYDKEIKYFNMPGDFYAKYAKNLLFLVLNSDDPSRIEVQKHWLEKHLKSTNKKTQVILVYHHSPVTLTPRHGWKEKKSFHEAVFPLILKYKSKIRLIIVGHDHITGLYEVNGIPLLVSGATFQVFKTPWNNYRDVVRNLAVSTKWNAKKLDPHWTRIDVDTEKKLIWLNMVNAKTESVSCSVLLSDEYKFRKDNCFKE
jgi:hypothetical protein